MRLALLLLLAASTAAQAGDDAISPDRPDFTNGPDVMAAGRFQLETSGAWQRDGSSRLRSTPTLLRLGLGHDLELRLDSDGALHQRNPDASGRGDLGLGFKWQLQDGDEGKPGLGVLVDVKTPTGSGVFKGHGLRPSLSFLAQWELPAGFSLGTMAGVLTDRNDADQRYTAAVLSASLGIPLGEKLHGFAEIAGQQLASARNGGNVVTAGTGVAWQMTNDVQLDTAVFRGLNHNTPDWAWTVGLSLRF
ncbi:transporter [Roseateles sp. NT4]|uniref:transporter n=1 Tax=Roseateles sp. NT4 TaxID=3453715 RepID=UPI003EEEDEE3